MPPRLMLARCQGLLGKAAHAFREFLAILLDTLAPTYTTKYGGQKMASASRHAAPIFRRYTGHALSSRPPLKRIAMIAAFLDGYELSRDIDMSWSKRRCCAH